MSLRPSAEKKQEQKQPGCTCGPSRLECMTENQDIQKLAVDVMPPDITSWDLFFKRLCKAYRGVLDLLANHEQKLDELSVCAGLFGSRDDLCMPAVIPAS